MMTAQNPEPDRKSSKIRRERKKHKGPAAAEERSPKGEGRAERAAPVPASFIEKTRKFLAAVISEFKRVSWPSRPELMAGTVVVVFTLVMFASYLGLLDFALGRFFAAVGR